MLFLVNGDKIFTNAYGNGSQTQISKIAKDQKASMFERHLPQAKDDLFLTDPAINGAKYQGVRNIIDSSTSPTKKMIRFQKFNFTLPNPPPIKFPLNITSAKYLRDSSKSVSVLLPDEGCTAHVDFEQVKDALRNVSGTSHYPPPHPDDIDATIFWEKFEEIVKVRSLIKRKEDNLCLDDPIKEIMPCSSMPEMWREYDYIDIAHAVHNEFPGIYHIRLIANWLEQKSLVLNNDVIPKNAQLDFLHGPVMLADMVGAAIRLVGDCIFSLKWEQGRARPEEIVWKIYMNEIEPPSSTIRTDILDMNLKSANTFTSYDEGSPTHPSWPAMHSASSSASLWLNVVANLTDEQKCEIRKLDYAIAFARTVAGVHYSDDNIAGLVVGQEILSLRLPEYLGSVYGANRYFTEHAIKNAQYNWTEFKDSDCYKGSAGVGSELQLCKKRNKKPRHCQNFLNLALNGTASQSDTLTRGNVAYTAGRAIDQNTDGHFGGGSVSCTKFKKYSWWRVDLPRDDAIVRKIVIWNRVDCCKVRLNKSVLQLTGSDGSVITKRIIDGNKEKFEWEFNGINVKAAKVMLLKRNYLHLAEVQLFGYYEGLQGKDIVE